MVKLLQGLFTEELVPSELFFGELRLKVAEDSGYSGGGDHKWPCIWQLPLDLAFFELVEGREIVVFDD